MSKYTADINNCSEGWVQVTISGPGAENLEESDIEAAFAAVSELMESREALKREREMLSAARYAFYELETWSMDDENKTADAMAAFASETIKEIDAFRARNALKDKETSNGE